MNESAIPNPTCTESSYDRDILQVRRGDSPVLPPPPPVRTHWSRSKTRMSACRCRDNRSCSAARWLEDPSSIMPAIPRAPGCSRKESEAATNGRTSSVEVAIEVDEEADISGWFSTIVASFVTDTERQESSFRGGGRLDSGCADGGRDALATSSAPSKPASTPLWLSPNGIIGSSVTGMAVSLALSCSSCPCPCP